MSKHMRLVVSVLFIVVIFLAIAITRFYSSTSGRTAGRNTQTDIERRLSSDSAGNRIFEDSSGLYGIIDGSDRVIVAAEWRELSFAGEGRCIASKRLGSELLKGCIDYEGNVIVPFIYRNIISRECGGQTFYVAESGSDNSVVLYDSSFRPVSRRVWKSCEFTPDELTLKSSSGTYKYAVSSDSMSLRSAETATEAMGCGLSLIVKNENYLAVLDPDMLEYMTAAAGRYLEFAYTGDESYISDIKTREKTALTRLFPEEKKILTRKLTGIKNIHFYRSNADSEEVPVFAVSITAVTDLTYYEKESSKTRQLSGEYHAVVEFSGTSVKDMEVISGGFTAAAPDYPKSDEKPEEPQSGEGSGSLLIPGPPELLREAKINY